MDNGPRGDFPVAPDLDEAVRRAFVPEEATRVVSALRGIDGDRLQVAVVVAAVQVGGHLETVDELIALSRIDFRDVLMVEYDKPEAYIETLERLQLVRPYPV